ncbi:MAG: endonuclease/exonuclease/phosphatase family protein [Bacteroidales bacterium]|nr:endonuclease/exonuclease/phosphatase family protein [Bacteroidales bacterium]
MKKLVLILAAVLLPLALSAKVEKEGVVAMSYNIRYGTADDGTNSWQYRYPASAMMLDELKPDVVGLQEALSSQVEYLATTLDKTYKAVGVGRDDGKKAGEIMAVLYNYKTTKLLKWGTFWLSDTPDTPSRGWDGACNRCATWAVMKDKATGKKFFFVNTHIDHVGPEAQQKGVKLIADKIAEMNKDGLPVIVTGDFNMEVSNDFLAPMKEGFQNARTAAVVTDDHFSYNGWGRAQSTIDYVWFKGFSCTRFETVTKPYYERTFISDHFPVKAVLVF